MVAVKNSPIARYRDAQAAVGFIPPRMAALGAGRFLIALPVVPELNAVLMQKLRDVHPPTPNGVMDGRCSNSGSSSQRS